MAEIFSSPLFGIFLSIIAFAAGVWMNKKTKNPLVSPLIIATVIIIAVLKIFNITFEQYDEGGSIITMLLGPATASLALSVYRNLKLLKKNLLPVLCGAGAGALASVVSVYIMCKMFGLDESLTAALLPKSVTTPIAVELSEQLGGLVPITVAAVVFTGISGAMFAPTLIKLFGFKNDIEAGVAIGTSSHAAGTSKAVEMGEAIGAMSGISIGIAGIFTVIYLTLI